MLDAALLRPGRFDRQIRVGAPSYDGRREIFEYYLAKVKHLDLPIDQMVAETVNYTPAQIKHIVNEAVVHAVWNGRDAIDYADFSWALETYEWGMRMPVIGMSVRRQAPPGLPRGWTRGRGGQAAQARARRASNDRGAPRYRRRGAGGVRGRPKRSTRRPRKSCWRTCRSRLQPRRRADLPAGEEMAARRATWPVATRIAEYMIKLLGMNGTLVVVRRLPRRRRHVGLSAAADRAVRWTACSIRTSSASRCCSRRTAPRWSP